MQVEAGQEVSLQPQPRRSQQSTHSQPDLIEELYFNPGKVRFIKTVRYEDDSSFSGYDYI